MKNQRFKRCQIILIYFYLFRSFFFIPKGIIDIVQDKQEINKTNFLKIKENFQSLSNGTSLTVFGWLLISQQNPSKQKLLKISTLIKSAKNNQFQNQEIFSLVYNDNDKKKLPFIALRWFFQEDLIKSMEKNVKIPVNEWFFISYGFDYNQKIHNFQLKFQNDLKNNLFFEFESDFKNFEFKSNIIFEIGCFQIENGDDNIDCMQGFVRNFAFIEEYFPNPKNLHVLNHKYDNPTVFYLDFYKQNKLNFQKIISQDQSTWLSIQGNFYSDPNTGMNTSKGKNTFIVNQNLNFDLNQPLQILSFQLDFYYQENLPKQLLLMSLNKNDKAVINVYLIIKNNKRFLQVKVVDPQLDYQSKIQIDQNKYIELNLAFIQDGSQFYIIINSKDQTEESQKFNKKVDLNNTRLFLLDKDQSIKGKGMMNFYILKIKNNIQGLIYQNISNKNSVLNLKSKCSLYESIKHSHINCSKCQKDYVLNKEGQCKNFCQKGTKNIGNKCFNCQLDDCPELNQIYFEIERINKTIFRLTQQNVIESYKGNLKDLFWVSYQQVSSNIEISYTLEQDFIKNQVVYYFDFEKEKNNFNGFITFQMNTDALLIDHNKNLIQNQNFKYPIDTDNIYGDPFGEDFTKNSNHQISQFNNDDLLENDKISKQYVANYDLSENLYQIFGIIAGLLYYYIFLICIIGNMVKTDELDDDSFYSFYFQKSIQSFLVIHYIAFLVFYQQQLPNNINIFLKSFYNFIIGWQGSIQLYFYKFDNQGQLSLFKNLGLLIIIHSICILFYFLFKTIYLLTKKIIKSQKNNSKKYKKTKKIKKFTKSALYHYEFKLLFSLIAIFSIDYSFFGITQLLNSRNIIEILIISLILTILYSIILFITLYPMKSITNLWNTNIINKYGFIYNGIELKGFEKSFQGLQYIVYTLIAIFQAVFINNQKLSGFLEFFVIFFFLLFIISRKPANYKYWKKEQTYYSVLLLCFQVVLILTITSSKSSFITEGEKYFLGALICIMIFIIILWNVFVLTSKFYDCIIRLLDLNKTTFSQLSQPELDLNANNKDQIQENVFKNQLKKKRTFKNNYNYDLKVNTFLEDQKHINNLNDQTQSQSSYLDVKIQLNGTDIQENHIINKKGSISKKIQTLNNKKDNSFNESEKNKLLDDIKWNNNIKSLFNFRHSFQGQYGKLKDLSKIHQKEILDDFNFESERSSHNSQQKLKLKKRNQLPDVSYSSQIDSSDHAEIEEKDLKQTQSMFYYIKNQKKDQKQFYLIV